MPSTSHTFTRVLLAVIASAALLQFASAQAGDAKDQAGQTQDAIWRDLDVPPAPVLSPEDALKSFSLPPGYSLELVAAEPLINDPVAITWDEQGRLWATEMWAYMPDVDGTGEHEPVSRVVVLEDLDQDGQMDRSTVFLDQLVLPRAVAIVHGGVLVADPPNLYFCEDTDGDLICDRKTVVAQYAVKGNVEHSENGLMRGLDNWLYNAKSDRRLKFENGSISEEKTNFRGQWGITMDDYGRLYYNTNSFFLYGDTVPWEYVSKNPGWSPRAGIETEVVKDTSVLTNRINPGINRAYRENWLRPDFRMKNADAASDPEIYRGNRYPADVKGNAFVPEPAGNVVSRFQLHDEGFDVVGEKSLHESPTWGPIEFLASTDERFRPVATSNGPDGFLYIVDMYRGILQHKDYLTSFLRTQIIERGLENPVGLGRIYRVVHENDSPSRSTPKLGQLTTLELVTRLSSDSGWERDTAQRLIVQSRTDAANTLDALNKLATHGAELASIHALWTLEGLQKITPETASQAYQHGSDWTRVQALRVASPFLANAKQTESALWASYQDALHSASPRLRLQAIQLLPEIDDASFAVKAISSLSPQDLSNPFFIDAAVSALHKREESMLATIQQSQPESRFSSLLTALTFALFQERNASATLAFANAAKNAPETSELRASILLAFEQALSPKNAKPIALDSAPHVLTSTDSTLAKAFTWPNKVDPDAKAIYQYTQADLDSIERGQPLFENNCAICHQSTGLGLASLAPPLVGTEWVTGSKRRLALIVGQGVTGPIEVNGQDWNSTMPPHADHPALKGEAITDLLNYIRTAWGNDASTFSNGEIRNHLESHQNRKTPWTVPELNSLEQN